MRLRTQREALMELHQKDPGSCLTAYAIRSMVLTGRIPTVAVGRKRLIDMDTLPDYLCAPAPIPVVLPLLSTSGTGTRRDYVGRK